MPPPIILLTGVTGYLGAHVLNLLMTFDYPVICTVRYLEQGLFFKTRYPQGSLAFVEVPDLNHEGALDHIFKHNRIRYVIHLATAYHEDYDMANCVQDLFDPCRKQVENVLESCASRGEHLKSVIMGSCFAAMVDDPPRFDDHRKVYTSRDMCCISDTDAATDKFHALLGAMTFAEDAAWDQYWSSGPSFSLMVIATPILLGPPINDVRISNISSSLNQMHDLITKPNESKVEPFPFPFYIDVRDAAQAIINAVEICEPETGRFFVCANNISSQQVVELARQVCPHLAPRLPAGRKGAGELELAGQCGFDRSENFELFKTKFIPLEDTIRDSLDALIALEEAEELRDIPETLSDLSISKDA